MKTLSTLRKKRRWQFLQYVHLAILFCLFCNSHAQVSPSVPATTAQHTKQVIGYITQWDAWKEVSNLVPKGGFNHLNVDYSQYTILNFSFFGVAKDGSLHSGDFRNKNIYQAGAVQEPAALVNEDIYSSWDLFLLYGELETLYFISDGSYAYSLGYRNEGSGWRNVNTGRTGAFPLSIHKQGGAPGVLELAHSKGVKVMASIGGWSMCKHYPEVAADAAKRAKFIANCKELIAMGFDGIDFDWEYPNDPGMNIERYSTADYNNFATLLEELRAAIGNSKLITSCFAASPGKLAGFNWTRMNSVLNYMNMMTYDYNGGWSNKAGHNAPLYDYPGMEYQGFSLDGTVRGIRNLGIDMSKVNLGAPFYGRGVITSGAAALNGATTKRAETVQPDGPIQTCADFTNWARDLWDGTPPYSYILQATGSGSGWTDHWDDVAKVPYKTKGNYFLSYDNERSIEAKAQYIKDQGLAGVIIWQVYGDMTDMISSTVAKGKLIFCPNTKSKLVNKINQVFANGSTGGNQAPTVSITAPANNATFTAPAGITLTANAADADGSISKVEFFNGSTPIGTATASPYTVNWSNVAAGSYSVTAVATDNSGATTTSSAITLTVNGNTGGNGGNKVIVGYWHNWGTATGTPPYIRLRDVNPKYNVIQIAFGMSGADHATISFTPEGTSVADFKADIQTLQSQGRKVLLSLGGENGVLLLNTAAAKTAFVNSMKSLLDQYNFDGFDIDLEGGSNLVLDNGDNNFMNPTTAKVVNLIAAVKEIISYRKANGKECWLTMAPETYYVQAAYASAYSPLVGAYLPLIYGLRNELTFIHPQLYNTGPMTGMDNKNYSSGNADFIVAMTEMLLSGFPVAGTSQTFPALREDQVAFGLPAMTSAAGSGYTTPVNVKNALNYLTKGQSFGGGYVMRKAGGYPGLRGIMTWSINWDKANGDEFANNYYEYFFGNTGGNNNAPVVSITSPANNATYTAPATVVITAAASDADGTVSKVEFFNGASKLGEATASPYTYTWGSVANGTYTLTARATDNKGAVTTSAAVIITVGTGGGTGCNGIEPWSATKVYVAPNQVVYNNKVYEAKWWTQNEQPDLNSGEGRVWKYISDCNGGGNNNGPVVTFTSPAAGANFTAPATITMVATASDADGSVSKVEFFNGATYLGEATASPYSYTWSNVAAGSYTLTAKATDNSGAVTTSAAVTITVGSSTGGGNCAGVAEYQPYPRIYSRGDKVTYNGNLYESQSDALYNVTPGTADWWWKPLGACSVATMSSAATNMATTVGGASVVPNPISGSQAQVLKYAEAGDQLIIEVQSARGYVVSSRTYTASATGVSAITIQTGGLAKGIWIVRITNKKTGNVSTTRLVKL
ncbi:glycosyl hydrolase family 18 protein [Longitalea luteola]|uniref:glycosyl hydrolase family 18 protein n=1 Tax=Longitalea luteola TaxID=2812563 RepID=UPI001A978BA2|nr:glycosyl hydrolase family 18 protein [Longitalea luteola]